MRLVIEGHDLPGRTFRNAGVPVYDVHVGIQVRKEPAELVPADAVTAEWQIDLTLRASDDGLDFAGPAVQGRRGERFVYLTWGNVGVGGGFEMMRRLKVKLDSLDRSLLEAAEETGAPIRLRIPLTDRFGGPRCGSLQAASLLAD